MVRVVVAAVWSSLLPALAVAEAPSLMARYPRYTTAAQLTVPVQQHVLANGLRVVLSPEPDATTVVVHHVLRAGAVYEPPGLSGMAHLVEHVAYRGPGEDADYDGILRDRGATSLSAFTSRHAMWFVVVVPPAQLPAAVWAAADRLAELPNHLARVDLERHKTIVLAERNERSVDREYGRVDEAIERALYPEAHPLHGGIGGTPESIARVTLDDVRAFATRYLVPANGVLVITGRFDPAVALQVVEAQFGGIPAGVAAADPPLPRSPRGDGIQLRESLSRQPRVTLAWAIARQPRDALIALAQGATLLTLSTDGALGTRVHASVDDYGPEAQFRMDVVLPYDKPRDSALGEADAFLRYLTQVDMDRALMHATNLHIDRGTLFTLDAMPQRAEMLGGLALDGIDVVAHAAALERHWSIDAATIQETARALLRGPRLVAHAQPERPRQPRPPREDRQDRGDDASED